MIDEIRIRASALSGWPDCPRRTAARLFWREIEAAGFKLRRTPFGVGAAIGTAVHFAAKLVLDEKARTGTAAPLSVATDAARDGLDDSIAKGIQFEEERGYARDRDTAQDQALRVTRSYHSNIVPMVEPVLVEQRLEAEIAEGVYLSGQPDLVAREPGQIRDLKTTARVGNASHAPQVGSYSLLARSHGFEIEQAVIDEVRRVSPRKEQPDPVSHKLGIARSETAAHMIIGQILHALKIFREGDAERGISPGDPWAFMANPNSNLCSARWCSAHSTEFCHEWKKDE